MCALVQRLNTQKANMEFILHFMIILRIILLVQKLDFLHSIL